MIIPPKVYWGQIEQIRETIRKIAPSDITILIQGETGTGKRLIAKIIHAFSRRKDFAFIPFSCASVPNELIEAELFGHEEEAFSGTYSSHEGLFQLAKKGTVLLEDIGDMSLDMQAKVLRILEDQKSRRFGSEKTSPFDIRIIATAKKDLIHAVNKGKFRKDLYYRLNVVAIKLPPLRERKEDVIPLAEYFMAGRAKKISQKAKRLLVAYRWPGNLWELKNCIDRAIVLGDGKTIRPEDLPHSIRKQGQVIPVPLSSLDHMEADHIIKVLKYTGWDKNEAAKILGILPQVLGDKIRKYKIMDHDSTNSQSV